MIDPQDICFCYLADAYHCDVYGCINDPLDQYIKQGGYDEEIERQRENELFQDAVEDGLIFYPDLDSH